jgi:hypothetical protein
MRMAPMPFPKASHFKIKVFLKLASSIIRVVHITSFNAWEDLLVARVQLKAFLLRREVSGDAILP